MQVADFLAADKEDFERWGHLLWASSREGGDSEPLALMQQQDAQLQHLLASIHPDVQHCGSNLAHVVNTLPDLLLVAHACKSCLASDSATATAPVPVTITDTPLDEERLFTYEHQHLRLPLADSTACQNCTVPR
jgi:hypothetical protein